MKKLSIFALVSLLGVGLIFAADFAPSKRSTELTKNPAVDGRVLKTDGTYNYWASSAIAVTEETTIGMTNATASGANNLVTPTTTLTPQTGNFMVSIVLEKGNAAGLYASVTNIIVTVTPAWTNATAATTPDMASNSVVVVTVTPQTAIVVTNVTATNP